ncbi:MAG: hypothetical protein AB1422_18830 [bacterium]
MISKCKCFICSLDAEYRDDGGTVYIVDCPRCSDYRISRDDRSIIKNYPFTQLEIANISGWFRENKGKMITPEQIEHLRKIKTPTVAEKAEKLLRFLVRKYPVPGQTFQVYQNPEVNGVSWTQNKDELSFIVNHYLVKCKQFLVEEAKDYHYKITAEGWAYIEELSQINPESQIAFIAMCFDKELDPLLRNVIEAGIIDAGYKPLRIDKHEHVNRIDDEIISMIKRSKFVVADFTGQRDGVYFEAGYALGMGLPVIWLCKQDEVDNNEVHFDVRQYKFITWKEDDFDQARKDLKNRIEAIIGRGKCSTTQKKIINT